MIVREWRDRVPLAKLDEYLDHQRRTGLRDYAATAGNRGVLVLVEQGTDSATVVVLSLWTSMDAIRRFAGEDVERARYYPEDETYLLDRPERLRHYRLCDASGAWTLAGTVDGSDKAAASFLPDASSATTTNA